MDAVKDTEVPGLIGPAGVPAIVTVRVGGVSCVTTPVRLCVVGVIVVSMNGPVIVPINVPVVGGIMLKAKGELIVPTRTLEVGVTENEDEVGELVD